MKKTTETKTMKTTTNKEGGMMEILDYLRDVLRRKKV